MNHGDQRMQERLREGMKSYLPAPVSLFGSLDVIYVDLLLYIQTVVAMIPSNRITTHTPPATAPTIAVVKVREVGRATRLGDGVANDVKRGEMEGMMEEDVTSITDGR